MVEGVGVSNVENWVLIFTGNALTFNWNTGLTALAQYKFKVSAINDANLQSVFSNVATYYAASLPAQIVFPANPFPSTSQTSIELTWT